MILMQNRVESLMLGIFLRQLCSNNSSYGKKKTKKFKINTANLNLSTPFLA